MPNIAAVFKTEIARIARKELKSQVSDLKKASTQHRAQIAAQRKRIESLERQLKRLGKGTPRAARASEDDGDDGAPSHRFSAKGFATLRKRLGISAAAMGQLIGVTGQSVYKWELGKARPRARQVAAIAALRGVGKREVNARLEALGAE
jgi:DNA-binding XRE family transcriptional regulator